jgi:deoxyadenosine/deoxycytidine kinase
MEANSVRILYSYYVPIAYQTISQHLRPIGEPLFHKGFLEFWFDSETPQNFLESPSKNTIHLQWYFFPSVRFLDRFKFGGPATTESFSHSQRSIVDDHVALFYSVFLKI